MSDAVIISLVAAIASSINVYITTRAAAKANSNHQETKAAVETLAVQTNGMSEKLVEAKGTQEYARGLQAGSDIATGAFKAAQQPPRE